MDLALLATIATAALGAGYLALGALRSNARRTRRVLQRTRVVPIAELVDGQLACVVGTVELDAQPIEAMVSRKPCVAYDTTVQFFQGTDFTVLPVRVEIERHMVAFFIVDGTGRARVDAPQAALCNRPIARSERFEERLIAAGDRIRLVGSVSLDPTRSATGEHSYREGAWTATITGSASYPLLIDREAR